LELTQDVADATLSDLHEQNEKVVGMQDDLAEMHDDLDVADRKLKGTGNFFGIVFAKKKPAQRHMKERGEYEKEMAKEEIKEEARRQKEGERINVDATAARMKAMQASLDDPELKRGLKEAKKHPTAVPKAGRQASEDGDADPMVFASGDFVFEERAEGAGEEIQAEKDLDAIHTHVTSLKEKAQLMGKSVDESQRRLGDLHGEMDRADARTKGGIKKGDKIIGK